MIPQRCLMVAAWIDPRAGSSLRSAGVATTKDDALRRALKKSRELTGATPGTLEAFLAVRSRSIPTSVAQTVFS
jgi:hypothetical protein